MTRPRSEPSTVTPPEGVAWFEPDAPLEELVLGGACGDALATIARELRHVPKFVRARIDPPTRILFSGPSGTGKTLAARWIGRQLGLPVAIADVSKAMGSHVGESAGNVGDLFDTARATKAILFLDEIDAIAVRRDRVGQDGADREIARATTVMFQKLDWLPREHIVIAATNFRDELDDALRRRFATQLAFELPDLPTRRRMISMWLDRVRVGADTLDRLAYESEGMSGADTRSLAMAHARRLIMADIVDDAPTPRPAPEPEKTPREYMESLFAKLDEIERRLPS